MAGTPRTSFTPGMGDCKPPRSAADAIERVLHAHSEGLTERDIRRLVIETSGLRCTPSDVRQALQSDRQRFVSLAHGIWRVASAIRADEEAAGADGQLRDERGQAVRPYFASLPALDSFIAFDVETTGLNPESHRIIQVAAVRMIGGQPAPAEVDDDTTLEPVFNSYVDLEGHTIPYGLRAKLGFVAHPEWEERLHQAPPLNRVLDDFRRWTGGLPLIAHNVRFDLAFLSQASRGTIWSVEGAIVDSMELACLARPDLPSARLEALAEALGVAQGSEAGKAVESWASACGVGEFSWSGFHNAVVDVLVLAALVPRLLSALKDRLRLCPPLCGELSRLFPGVARLLRVDTTPDADPHSVPCAVSRRVGSVPQSEPRLQIEFTPAKVRERFERMVAEGSLRARESQFNMVESVSLALLDGRFMAIEAPTGTGKTFAYLVPSLLWARSQGETVAISTHTRLLQDQMLGDVSSLSRHLNTTIRAQVIKGKANYVCLERAARVYAQADLDVLDDEERFAWLCLLAWLSATQEGLLDELSYWALETFPALDRLCDSLRCDPAQCPGSRCSASDVCWHRLAYERAAKADLVVMNHALLLSKEWAQCNVQFRRVVVDEAHSLEDAATDVATDEVSRESILRLVNRLLDRRAGQGVLIRIRAKVHVPDGQRLIARALERRNLLAALADDFGARLQTYAQLHRTSVDPRYGAKLTLESDPRRANPTSWRPVQESRQRLVQALNEAAEALYSLQGWLGDHPLPRFQAQTRNELGYLTEQLREQATLLQSLLRVGYDRLSRVHWIEVERAIHTEQGAEAREYHGPYRWAVKRAPVRVGSFLNQRLYDRVSTLVLTSATLRTTQDVGFGYLLDRLGLLDRAQPVDAIALPPAFDYSRALFGVARYMRSDARPGEIRNFEDEVGQELGWFFQFVGGNGLGLFTARDRLLKAFAYLEPVLGEHCIPVGCQGQTGSRRALLEDLKFRAGSVVLGLKSFWQGVDVPGPNLSYVVMEKLPFPSMGEPVVRARASEVRERKGHEFMDYLLPLMLMDFKQGFGRLIRKEEDIGAVLLLDKRVWNRDYFRDLKAALPGASDAGYNTPPILDDQTSLSRRAVYRAIAEHMAAAPPEWRIDLQRMEALLSSIPDALLTHVEQLLADLRLPDTTPLERLGDLWHKVTRGLKELFHFESWRPPEQQDVVRALLTGQDALVVLPTGSGKSLTFQLAALLRGGTTIVFSPLKALMKDQVDKLLDQGLALADRIDSSQTPEEHERVYQRMREGTTRLVYIAPERVRDPRLMAALRAAHNIVQVVVDEAHCVHMWGQSFRPDFLYISRLLDAIQEVQERRPAVAALTATATPLVRQSIVKNLHLRDGYATIERNPNRPELRYVVYNRTSAGFRIKTKRDKLEILLRILRTADRNDENTIVYVNTTLEAERLSRRLEALGLDVRHYHGKMDDQARKDVQDMFLEGQVKAIVATKAFGMGIDKQDIRYVVHYQIPGDVESYFQETGRAGRDGKTSWCVLLYHSSDLWIHENYFIPGSLPDHETLRGVLHWLSTHRQSGAETIYADPREMADSLGFDEDRELGIHLHHLEQLGFVVRETDVTLRASTRLLIPLELAIAHAEDLVGGRVSEAVRRVLRAYQVNTTARSEVAVVEGAASAGVTPDQLDDALQQLALRGDIIFRAFARAFTLRPGPAMLSGRSLNANMDQVTDVRDQMVSNLAAMRRYAEALRVGDCLRGNLLAYLGAQKPPTRGDTCCSLCDPNVAVPWASERVSDRLTDPARYQDTRFEVLRAVAWNAALANQPGRAPYGSWTLAQILVGNDFILTKYQTDPHRKQARRHAIVTSEHFGALEGLPGGAKVALAALDSLRGDGFVSSVDRVWDEQTYQYPAPTDKGWARLREGRLFDEDNN